ncbi:DUF6454 family protein [Pelagibacterium sp. 26DY04]|uniref:DUF6454 family protein n=1 Tax=Pelagibacterium sp. 26DY04 TaxID=2967130 RepID=UPI002815DD57|nr:DUF6454 family protein [Pelagibacterium sp. 26DY04]WMT88575.1 DUF6454 family protein [Pelagibacterium sp. 26DY04]
MRPLSIALTAALALAASPAISNDLSDAIKGLTRSTTWTLVDEVPLNFNTHHPQGMYRIGDDFIVSTVEIITRTQRYDTPQDGYDRDAGEGRGWLYRFSAEGELLDEVELGEGDIYHPGGIDFDGEAIWVPVAEYRPDSASIVYRVDPETFEAEEVFRFRDHLGGIVHNLESGSLHAVSWGSRRFYDFDLASIDEVEMTDAVPLDEATMNSAFYVDYQDCHYLAGQEMICSGVSSFTPPNDAPSFGLGGLEIVNLEDDRPVHQVPVALWSPAGRPMSQNPFFLETTENGIRAYFIPDDEDSVMFVYEAEL